MFKLSLALAIAVRKKGFLHYLLVFSFSLHLFSHHESSASMQLNKRCYLANHLPPPNYFCFLVKQHSDEFVQDAIY